VTATFQPVETDDLRTVLANAVGWRGEWTASWVIEDGPHAGQWAWTATDGPFPHWVPTCDLVAVVQNA
jgi:hypothetical protein